MQDKYLQGIRTQKRLSTATALFCVSFLWVKFSHEFMEG